jgi:Tetratricopeptide repeat
MDTLKIKYRTAGAAFVPRPVRLGTPEPELPIECGVSFGEAATYGVELVYQYQTDCHIVNDNGEMRMDWDYRKVPGALGYDEFSDTVPKPSEAFIFATSVDLQAPPGYVLRMEPHPRFFTDTTGTVPPAIAAQVRTEWWPKKVFVVFKAPPRGQQYVFRQGEPYVQIFFVPQDRIFEPQPMSTEQPLSRDSESGTPVVVKYRTIGNALPPQPTRLAIPGWSGLPEIKMENGSQPQPWHCSPFREGATYGLELLFQHDSECHVINDNGQIRFDWNDGQKPEGNHGFFEIGAKPCRFFGFDTSVELQAPPGYVLRTVTHPRFHTDRSGTVPAVLCCHGSSGELRKLSVVFKAPAPGERHVFRKGEPYVQILFVPQPVNYELVKMSREEETRRNNMESGIFLAKSYLAKHIWHNPDGIEFNDHYRVLERAFEHQGVAGVQATIEAAVKRKQEAVPTGKTIAEYLKLADAYRRDGKYLEAKDTLVHARGLDPLNHEVACRIGILQWAQGLRTLGLGAMEMAVRLQPNSPLYLGNLGEMLRQVGRLEDAIACLRKSLQLQPNDAQVMRHLDLALTAQKRESHP